MENISKRGGKERESGKIQNYGVAPIKPSEHQQHQALLCAGSHCTHFLEKHELILEFSLMYLHTQKCSFGIWTILNNKSKLKFSCPVCIWHIKVHLPAQQRRAHRDQSSAVPKILERKNQNYIYMKPIHFTYIFMKLRHQHFMSMN